jgi:hypothetical protein
LIGDTVDIEERAEKWADTWIAENDHGNVDCLCDAKPDLIAAYLAGSAQTQADYTAGSGR